MRSIIMSNFRNIFIGAAIGFLAWGNHIYLSFFAPLILVLYFYSSTRTDFFILISSYYLAASRGLLSGTATYYDNILFGVLIWCLAAFIVSGTWVILWSNQRSKKVIFFFVSLCLVSLPPIGLISWANPLFSAGIFFPHTGFFGVFLLALFAISLGLKNKYLFGGIAIISIVANLSINKNLKSYSIECVNTNYGQLYKQTDYLKTYKINMDYLAAANTSKSKYILLPEDALGKWNDNNMMIWSALSADKTVFAGATLPVRDSNKTENIVLEITNSGYKILYKERMPVPISMWRPFGDVGTQANLFNQVPLVFIEHIGNVGIVICYEQLLFFTLIQTMYHNPDVIFGISNLWWAIDPSIYKIQVQCVDLTSRLFDTPYYMVYNK